MTDQCEVGPVAQGFIILSAVLFVLMTVLTPLRIYTRLRITKAFGWDDTTILIAYGVAVIALGVFWHMCRLGFGLPIPCLEPAKIYEMIKLGLIAQSVSFMSMTASRLSVAIFLLRIFSVKRWFRRFVWAWIICITVQQLVVAGLTFAVCTPVEALWPWNPDQKAAARCWPAEGVLALELLSNGVAALSDLILALTPAPFLYTLQAPARTKLGLVMLMALNLLPAACAAGRTWALVTDRGAVVLFMFGGLEMFTLVICACLPTMAPLWKKIRSRGTSVQSTPHKPYKLSTRVTRKAVQEEDRGRDGFGCSPGGSKVYLQGFGSSKAFDEEDFPIESPVHISEYGSDHNTGSALEIQKTC